jgi:hypothetical protein
MAASRVCPARAGPAAPAHAATAKVAFARVLAHHLGGVRTQRVLWRASLKHDSATRTQNRRLLEAVRGLFTLDRMPLVALREIERRGEAGMDAGSAKWLEQIAAHRDPPEGPSGWLRGSSVRAWFRVPARSDGVAPLWNGQHGGAAHCSTRPPS